MVQHKRFGRRVGLQSTVQIIRELKMMVQRDAEAAVAAPRPDAVAPPLQDAVAASEAR